MSRITVRPIRFGDWRRWDKRRMDSVGPSQGGVYLLAHCRSGSAPVTATVDSLPREVVYVGNTKDLDTRPGIGSHDGVKRYRQDIDSTDERLFVAFAPLYESLCEDYAMQRVYAEYAEAMLVWRFTEQHGHPPALHYGHKGHNREQVGAVIRALRGDAP